MLYGNLNSLLQYIKGHLTSEYVKLTQIRIPYYSIGFLKFFCQNHSESEL